MFVRAYKVDTNEFRGMRGIINAAEALPGVIAFRTFSEHKGLDLSPPTAVSDSPEQKLLVVSATTLRHEDAKKQ